MSYCANPEVEHPGFPCNHPEPVAELDAAATAICDGCGERHAATYSHEGRFSEGPIWAVTCDRDWLTSYHTREGVDLDELA